MKIDWKRTFYYLGSAMLLLAICILTVLPYFVGQSFYFWCPIDEVKTTAAKMYLTAFVFYFLCPEYFKRQLVCLGCSFAFFFAFLFFVDNF